MMRFLIDEDMPRSLGDLLRRYGHEAMDVRNIGLRGVDDSEIASYARENRLAIITGDFGFADIRNYPPAKYNGFIVLVFPEDADSIFISNLLEDFLQQDKLVSQVSGKLVIVEPGRVRIRK